LAIFDLFVSYSSKDRPWAKKLWEDLRAQYPSLRIFWDRDSILAGEAWRKELQSAIRNSKHLVVFWSEYANTSLEVGPEIEAFNAHRDLTPQLEGSDRKGFYIPLEGNRGGGIGDFQGFDDFRTIYNPQSEDRGIGGVADAKGQDDWVRMIRMVGDAVSQADQAQEVIAAVVATTVDPVVEVLDKIHGKRARGIPLTLDQFLAGFNLQWTDVRERYGPSALDWRPTGDRTIVELLEGVRVRVNAKLDPADHFRWRYVDLTTDEGLDLAPSLHKKASVVIFDPVSLYDQSCANAMRRLTRYVLEKHSVILSLSPALSRDEDVYATCVRDLSLPLFDDYFHPEIPPRGEFLARCAPEVQREAQIERLMRNRIRDLRSVADEAAGKATTGHK
jgi:hypothetical protein